MPSKGSKWSWNRVNVPFLSPFFPPSLSLVLHTRLSPAPFLWLWVGRSSGLSPSALLLRAIWGWGGREGILEPDGKAIIQGWLVKGSWWCPVGRGHHMDPVSRQAWECCACNEDCLQGHRILPWVTCWELSAMHTPQRGSLLVSLLPVPETEGLSCEGPPLRSSCPKLHFTGEPEAQRRAGTCPRSHSKPGLETKSLASQLECL